ncbi:MAG: hypothetical protein ACI8QT_001581 [Halioglobus sp.]|jgi:hypothetical protein
MKRTFTQDERDIVFDLWKQGAEFSGIGRVIDAKSGSIFTILRGHGGIQPEKISFEQWRYVASILRAPLAP